MTNKFISFSGGVESTAMCVLYGADAKAIWCDTGSEHDEMYARIDFCEAAIKKIHPNFEIIRLKPNVKVKGKFVSVLTDAIIGWKFMPSQGRRWCTGSFKIEPIDNFLAEQGECELMIGLNTDEETRSGNWGMKANVKYSYPLQEDDLTRDDCKDVLEQYNLLPDFPLYMNRGGCYMCIFKSISEYKAMYLFDRKTFERVGTLEESIQDKRNKFFTISTSQKSMRWIAEQVETEITGWGGIDVVKAFYQQIEQKQACGAFCHR
ncbi:MAG: phosphoadenosine phosphosulfate reductase family protein [Bacteroidia bacterium]|nr:phosphoadenosine phosphosulfate reductase family protein [Bacteroidia bacterium]